MEVYLKLAAAMSEGQSSTVKKGWCKKGVDLVGRSTCGSRSVRGRGQVASKMAGRWPSTSQTNSKPRLQLLAQSIKLSKVGRGKVCQTFPSTNIGTNNNVLGSVRRGGGLLGEGWG